MKRIAIAAFLCGATLCAQAAPVVVSSVAGSGVFNGSSALIADGVVTPEYTGWTSSQNVWWYGQEGSGGAVFTLSFDGLYQLSDVVLSVDNDDDYQVDVSADGVNWASLFTVSRFDGNVDEAVGGMDVMSSVSGDAQYDASVDFAAISGVRYARIYATGGNGNYAIGELAFSGALLDAGSNSVPEPGALALAGLGLAGVFAQRRRARATGRSEA